ncbi:glucose-6-phosphate dehydrogenase [Propioniciclava tarda]|uniref:Glucose-6-phosphate dehydrogenase n=1 Tax=Propioniciclava tarda TaxID=433330 RepID=A0A4Q9KKG1_PROTD|nr:glucose-6-phosphate dehydrogenase [Propioniciclava tarda]
MARARRPVLNDLVTDLANVPAASTTAPGAAQEVTLVIFGASGDLTHRLLLPGLGTLLNSTGRFAVTVIGAAMDDVSDDAWKQLVRDALTEAKTKPARIEEIVARTRYVKIDVTDPQAIGPFVSTLPPNSVLYFALPPAVTIKACQALVGVTLPEGLRLGLEKPFGTSGSTAHDFNTLLAKLVPERQIFRIDHFLGKATVLNLLGLRFTNRIFEPVWNGENIESVAIVVDEVLALEGRAGYYDRNGALRDMIQSHLLLVMALFAMEEVASIDEREVRDLVAHTLRATSLWTGDPVTSSRRARYTAGHIGDREVPDYTAEDGVDPARNTETLAEVDLRVNNARWAGVKFTLRSGKALGDERNGITAIFKPVAHVPVGFKGEAPRNVLSIGIKPQTIALQLSTNGAGDKFDLEETVLSTDLDDSPLRPYGEILEFIFEGNPILSVRGDVAEECWRIVGPVLDAWASGAVPMSTYRAGWAGPTDWV